LAAYLPDWATAMFDRIFMLMEAQEAAVAHSQQSAIVGSIAQCVAFFFQSVGLDDPIRQQLEDKVLEYFLKFTPLNAAKVSAKMVESLVFSNPSKLGTFLGSLLDARVLSASYAAEKVAFRIRLAAGACKQATGVALLCNDANRVLLTSVITSQVSLTLLKENIFFAQIR